MKTLRKKVEELRDMLRYGPTKWSPVAVVLDVRLDVANMLDAALSSAPVEGEGDAVADMGWRPSIRDGKTGEWKPAEEEGK